MKTDIYLQMVEFIFYYDHLYSPTVTYEAVAIRKKVPSHPVSLFTTFIVLQWITLPLSDRMLQRANSGKL